MQLVAFTTRGWKVLALSFLKLLQQDGMEYRVAARFSGNGSREKYVEKDLQCLPKPRPISNPVDSLSLPLGKLWGSFSTMLNGLRCLLYSLEICNVFLKTSVTRPVYQWQDVSCRASSAGVRALSFFGLLQKSEILASNDWMVGVFISKQLVQGLDVWGEIVAGETLAGDCSENDKKRRGDFF